MSNLEKTLRSLLKERILLIDGALGTMIRDLGLQEDDFRGSRFASHAQDLRWNNEILVLVRPELIQEIHESYLEAGADIVETNTFKANRISQAAYGTADLVHEMNVTAARIAKAAATKYSLADPSRPKFVAGVIGHATSQLASSGDNSTERASFTDLVSAYKEQISGLIVGGVDILLIETVIDIETATAALAAAEKYWNENQGTVERVPVIVSGTLAGHSGPAGQTTERFYESVATSKPLCVGLNCTLTVEQARSFLQNISNIADCFVHLYPNAGFTTADETPEHFADAVKELAHAGLLNMVGGCCGTTPKHIATLSRSLGGTAPRVVND